MSLLFEQLSLNSELTLPNRVVMAPLTRCRAQRNGTPNSIMATYYAQRASAGLIITEATGISDMSMGYPYTPGIWSQEHIDAWREISSAVHAQGGRMFMQLWHVGRVSHPDFIQGKTPVSASSVAHALKEKTTYDGPKPYVLSRSLAVHEIQDIVKDFTKAAENAVEAGMDGVEIHGANGYLIEQFLAESTNQRTDEYGGSIENRCRFAIEVVRSVCTAIGSRKVGIRLSPSGMSHDVVHSQPDKTYAYLLNELSKLELAYVHFEEPFDPPENLPDSYATEVLSHYHGYYNGIIICNGGLTKTSATTKINNQQAHLAAFGRWYISNPDLVVRLENDWPIASADEATFYGPGEKGYADYPEWQVADE